MTANILWFTGLSGSGKSTLANALAQRLGREGCKVRVIDGDDVRRLTHQHLGFTPEDIRENNRLILELCIKLLPEFDFILVPVISPFEQTRQNARQKLGKSYHEVYVKCSLDEVFRRDAKGLYQKALKGEIDYFIGIDPRVPYEEPSSPELVLDTGSYDQETLLKTLCDYIEPLKLKTPNQRKPITL